MTRLSLAIGFTFAICVAPSSAQDTKLEGYGDDLPKVIEQATAALNDEDFESYVNRMLPASALALADGKAIAAQLKANPKLVASMVLDLKAIDATKPTRVEAEGNVTVFVLSEKTETREEHAIKFEKVAGSWRLFDATSATEKAVAKSLRAGDSDEKWQQADKLIAELAGHIEAIDKGIEKANAAADDVLNTSDGPTAQAAAKMAAKHANGVVATIKLAIKVGNAARSLGAKAEGAGLKNKMEDLHESSKDLIQHGFEALRIKESARRTAARIAKQ